MSFPDNIKVLRPFLLWIGIILAFSTNQILGQTVDHIRNSGNYYWGIGTGSNYSAARRNALENLTESISVNIKTEFEQIIKETNQNLDVYVKSVITTYSTAVINQYQERVLKEIPGHSEVLVYITKRELDKVFKQRENLITDLVNSANQAKNELRISDALRYYYWALVLTRSHPDNSKLRHVFDGVNQEPLMLGLFERMNRILSLMSVEVTTIREQSNPVQKEIGLVFRYNGVIVQDLDYYYWVGDGYSTVINARNGIGVAILYGEAARNFHTLRVRIEYAYGNKAHLEPEVQMMLESVEIPYFERAQIAVSLIASSRQTPENSEKVIIRHDEIESSEAIVYRGVLQQIIQSIVNRSLHTVFSYFTEDGHKMFLSMMGSGNVRVLDQHLDTLSIVRVGNETMVRSVPMMFAFHNNRERFVENVVFTFNDDKKISSLSYALSDIAINDIVSKPLGFGTIEDKYFLIRFMEDYKTAYSLKRLDYIEAIFDENALIIVGNVVKRMDTPIESIRGMYGNLSREQVEYIWLSKAEYMERLRRIFRRNEFINIRFEDNQVRKTERDDKIYGIQIAQHYYSSTYADKGYLFLMIDLNDTINPKIYVRTWQPVKNPDGSIYGLEDFRF